MHTFTNQKKCTTTKNKHKQVLSSSGDGRPFGHNRHGPKIGGCAPYGGEAGSPRNTMWPTFVPSGILIHPAVWPQQTWPKVGGSAHGAGGAGPHQTQCCPGRGLPPYQVASLSIQPFGHNKHGPKSGAVPLLGEGNWVPI